MLFFQTFVLINFHHELEVYLNQEESFQQFLEDGKYKTWKKEEEAENGKRITELEAEEG